MNNDSSVSGEPRIAHQIALENGRYIQAYTQSYNGVVNAHLRVVNVAQNGTVKYTSRGVSLPVERADELLRAVALLAVASAVEDV